MSMKPRISWSRPGTRYLQLLARYPRTRLPEAGRDVPVADLVSAELAATAPGRRSRRPPSAARPLPTCSELAYPGGQEQPDVRDPYGRGDASRPAVEPSVPGRGAEPRSPRPDHRRAALESRYRRPPPGSVILPTRSWSLPRSAWPPWTRRRAPSSGVSPRRGPSRPAAGPIPSPAPSPPRRRGPRRRVPLHDFQLVGGRLFCLRGEQEILAIDGDTGSIDWSFSPRAAPSVRSSGSGPSESCSRSRTPTSFSCWKPTAAARSAGLRWPRENRWTTTRADRRGPRPARAGPAHGQEVSSSAAGSLPGTYRESPEMPVNGPPRRDRLTPIGSLVLHDGRILIRLDPSTDRGAGATLLGIEDLSERLGAIACDEHRVYCVSQEAAGAFDRRRSPLWTSHLIGPENALWSIALSERCVVAYPSSRQARRGMESMPVVVRRQRQVPWCNVSCFPRRSPMSA